MVVSKMIGICGILAISAMLLAGCEQDPIFAQDSHQMINLNVTQSGEGTDKSPKDIKMHVATPDGDMSMNMRVSESSFSMSIGLPRPKSTRKKSS